MLNAPIALVGIGFVVMGIVGEFVGGLPAPETNLQVLAPWRATSGESRNNAVHLFFILLSTQAVAVFAYALVPVGLSGQTGCVHTSHVL